MARTKYMYMKWIRFRKTTFKSGLDVADLPIVALRRLWAVNFSRSIEEGDLQLDWALLVRFPHLVNIFVRVHLIHLA